MKTVNLKGQEWATENYNVVTFRNGDPIPFAKTPEEFKEFTSLKKPCYTYYNYDVINSKYGCCYNWFSLIDKRGLVPEGFKVPNNEDFSILFDNYIGRDRLDDDKRVNQETHDKQKALKSQFYTSLKAKETWYKKNLKGQDLSGTDTLGFSLLAVPDIYESRGYKFSEIGDTFGLWSFSKDPKYRWKLSGQYFAELSGHEFKAKKDWGSNDCGCFIRLIKDMPIENSENNEVEIGSQIWMNSNLNVDKFNNGDIILEAKTKEDWDNAGINGIPAWCYYDNDENNGNIHKKLYNWFAVNDPRGIVPNGFTIPSKEDFNLLINELNGRNYFKQKLKSKLNWPKGTEGTNSSGFNAIPSGSRELEFKYINKDVYFWTSSEEGKYAFAFWLGQGSSNTSFNKSSGFSVRCIKHFK
jgi:uncharacterized protein (TIGR02145 family)